MQLSENDNRLWAARFGVEFTLKAKGTIQYRNFGRLDWKASALGFGCMPCPNGVWIPANFDFYNYAHLYDDVSDARFKYEIFLNEAQRSSACIACGVCEGLCPQHIAISEEMAKVTALLA